MSCSWCSDAVGNAASGARAMAIHPMHGGLTAACSVQGATPMSGASLSRDRTGGSQANTQQPPPPCCESSVKRTSFLRASFSLAVVSSRRAMGTGLKTPCDLRARQSSKRMEKTCKSAGDALFLHSACYNPCRGLRKGAAHAAGAWGMRVAHLRRSVTDVLCIAVAGNITRWQRALPA